MVKIFRNEPDLLQLCVDLSQEMIRKETGALRDTHPSVSRRTISPLVGLQKELVTGNYRPILPNFCM
ncbi:hypothetical protein [Sphingobacterium sp. JB170]|uniref:hypothetical protein n=1 Tax=Sphingobacterium sp. JB170 TaxID=1434842 RepID=UPI00117A596F|nr:hypothetical protein [Sphingobacterium sp. JB170]